MMSDQPGARLTPLEEAIAILKDARHALVTSQGLRATDVTLERFDALIASGVGRDELEWTIDDSSTLAAIDTFIAAHEEGQAA